LPATPLATTAAAAACFFRAAASSFSIGLAGCGLALFSGLEDEGQKHHHRHRHQLLRPGQEHRPGHCLWMKTRLLRAGSDLVQASNIVQANNTGDIVHYGPGSDIVQSSNIVTSHNTGNIVYYGPGQ
jgi:hypothetical protein